MKSLCTCIKSTAELYKHTYVYTITAKLQIFKLQKRNKSIKPP